MIGHIGFKDFSVTCIIGTEDRERTETQELRVDLSLAYPIEKPAKSDDLSHAIDYTQLAREVSKHLIQGRYRLMERAAETLVHALRTRYASAMSIHLKIRKHPPGHPQYFVEVHWKAT